jgi:hypothetical protein
MSDGMVPGAMRPPPRVPVHTIATVVHEILARGGWQPPAG